MGENLESLVFPKARPTRDVRELQRTWCCRWLPRLALDVNGSVSTARIVGPWLLATARLRDRGLQLERSDQKILNSLDRHRSRRFVITHVYSSLDAWIAIN